MSGPEAMDRLELLKRSKGVIDNWVVLRGCFYGFLLVPDDPNCWRIRTSSVKPEYLVNPQQGDLIQTRNSVYELGSPMKGSHVI